MCHVQEYRICYLCVCCGYIVYITLLQVALVDIQHTEKLYDDTRNIYEKYNPSRVKAVRDVASNRVYSAQSFFYSAVRTGCETLGVELDEPSSIYEPIRPRLLDRTHGMVHIHILVVINYCIHVN